MLSQLWALSLYSFSSHYLLALIVALVFLDIGGRAGLVGNQLRALALSTEGRSRLNTVLCVLIL